MTQTLEPDHWHGAVRSPYACRDRLADFEAALAAGTSTRAAGLFATTSFWRDLIAFSWNITTVENRDGVADLLRQTLETTGADGLPVAEGEQPARPTASARRGSRSRRPSGAARACCG